jgi:hypothetical protein
LVLYRASAEEKSSAPSDADSDQKVEMEGLFQRAIGTENNGNRILAQITEPLPMNEREYCSISVALHSGTVEYALPRSILSDCNYRQGNAQRNSQDNVLGNTKKDNVPGNAKEDDAQDTKDEINLHYPLSRYYHSLRARQLEQLKSFPALAFYIICLLPKKPS